MKSITTRKVLVFVFYAIAVVSVFSLVPSTLNYLEFYVALSHLYLDVDSFNFTVVDLGLVRGINLTATFSLIQNSSYSGLKVLSVYVNVLYGESFTTLFERRFWFNDVPIGSFGRLNMYVVNETVTDIIIGNEVYTHNVQDFVEMKERGEAVQGYLQSSVFIYLMGNPIAETIDLDTTPLAL